MATIIGSKIYLKPTSSCIPVISAWPAANRKRLIFLIGSVTCIIATRFSSVAITMNPYMAPMSKDLTLMYITSATPA